MCEQISFACLGLRTRLVTRKLAATKNKLHSWSEGITRSESKSENDRIFLKKLGSFVQVYFYINRTYQSWGTREQLRSDYIEDDRDGETN